MRDAGGKDQRVDWRGYLFAPRIAGAPRMGGTRSDSWIFNPYLLFVFRLVLAAVFIYAAVQKVGKPLAFADEIKMYGILDIGLLLYITAIALPWIELLCGISLVTGIFMRGTALILLLLNGVFLVAVSVRTGKIMRADGIPFMQVYYDCGCGFGATYAWKKLAEDAIFFLLSLALLLAPVYRFVLVPLRRKW